MDIAYSAVLQYANDRFDQLASGLAVTLRKMPAAQVGGDDAPATNLLSEFLREKWGDGSVLSGEAWDVTLDALLSLMIDAIPMAERRLLYLATNNGGEECVTLDRPEDIPLTGPWIAEEILRRLPCGVSPC